jgi:hypothetical protein
MLSSQALCGFLASALMIFLERAITSFSLTGFDDSEHLFNSSSFLLVKHHIAKHLHKNNYVTQAAGKVVYWCSRM